MALCIRVQYMKRKHIRGYDIDDVELDIKVNTWYLCRDGELAFIAARNPIVESKDQWLGFKRDRYDPEIPGRDVEVYFSKESWGIEGIHGGTATRHRDLMSEVPEEYWPGIIEQINIDEKADKERFLKLRE